MQKKKRRNCIDCIEYYNLLRGSDYRCGFGFEIAETIDDGHGTLTVAVHPLEDKCEVLSVIPKTREGFIKTAASLGINWDINDVVTVEV